MRYMTEDNRPQVQLDVDYEKGMGVSIGRIREDSIYDYKLTYAYSCRNVYGY